MQLTMPSRKSPEGKGERKQYGSSLLTLGCRFPKVSFLWILFCTKSPTICGASLVAQRLNIHLQCRRPGFDPWVGNIPWRRKWQPTPVLLPRKSYGRRSLVQATAHGVTKSWTQLSDFTILNKVTSTQCQYKIAKYSTDYLFSIWKSLVRDLLHLYA